MCFHDMGVQWASAPSKGLVRTAQEFFFLNDGSGAVLFRWAGRVNVASPPGCFKPGCINGPRQRARAEALQRELGWLPLETDEEKKWVPLLLH